MHMDIHRPDTIADCFGTDQQRIGQFILGSAVLEGVRTRLLTTKKAGDLLGPARHDMYELMRQHAIPLSTLDDVRKDHVTSERLGLSGVLSPITPH